MRNQNSKEVHSAVVKMFLTLLFATVILATAGCDGPDEDEGVVANATPLPSGSLLNLNCADVGINIETCVLTDPENPFVDTVIVEFNENNVEAFNKFELAGSIPAGPAGAKSRFYFWATALARQPNGENQFFTAVALHEIFTVQAEQSGTGDPIVQEQALKAYQSLLDNFFESVVFFACFFDNGVFITCAGDPMIPDTVAAEFPIPLSELAACNLFFKEATATQEYPNGFERLEMGDELNCADDDVGCLQLATLDLLGEWGFAYQAPANGVCDQGVVTANP